MAARKTGARQWLPTGTTGAEIFELAKTTTSIDALCSELESARTELTACSLTIARLKLQEGADVAVAIAAVQAQRLPFRVCLAIDAALLRGIAFSLEASDRVGLLLDDVDAQVPLAYVAHQALEAIRFESGFVRSAAEHLRSLCVLDALLGLACDIGLCTFGPVVGSDSVVRGAARFDYVADMCHLER